MPEEFANVVFKRFTGEIAARLTKASTLATAAESLSSQGLSGNAYDTLIEVEPLIFQAKALLNAASIVRRSDGDDRCD